MKIKGISGLTLLSKDTSIHDGLNDGFNQARSQILMKSKMLSVNKAYALAVLDEVKVWQQVVVSIIMKQDLFFSSLLRALDLRRRTGIMYWLLSYEVCEGRLL